MINYNDAYFNFTYNYWYHLTDKGFTHLVCVCSKSLSLDIASNIIVLHADAELDVILHVHHAAVGVVLGVDLAGEDLVGGDGGHHLGGATVDGDIVAGAQLECSSHVSNDQEWILDVGQCCGGVMRKTTYPVTRVSVVKTVTSEKYPVRKHYRRVASEYI